MRAYLLIESVHLIGVPLLDTEGLLVALLLTGTLNLKMASSFNRFAHRWINSPYSKAPLTKSSNSASKFSRASKYTWTKKSKTKRNRQLSLNSSKWTQLPSNRLIRSLEEHSTSHFTIL